MNDVCMAIIGGAMAELPQKVCYVTSDGIVAINLYTPFTKTINVDGASIKLSCKTDYPNSGDVIFEVGVDSDVPLAFRVPRWCNGMTASVNGCAAVEVRKSDKGLFYLNCSWKAGDKIKLSMPMPWRLVRGREMQVGRVALMRGPMVFCLGRDQNAALFKRFPRFRDLIVDPASVGNPMPDSTIRENGVKVSALAWMTADCAGDKVPVAFTEFADPSGQEIYFRVPDMDNTGPLALCDDEIISQ